MMAEPFYYQQAEPLGPNQWKGIPDLEQVLREGGRPGVEYCWVSGERLGHFVNLGWSEIIGLPVQVCHGPKAICDSVKLLGIGEPIEGASPAAGRRRLFVDEKLLHKLGYDLGPSMSNLPMEEVQSEGRRQRARSQGAARGKEAADGSSTAA